MDLKISYAESAALLYQQRSTRIFSATSQSPWYIGTVDFNLPEMLTNEYFDRHQLSIKDYERILQSNRRVHFLYALAISKNIPVTLSNTPLIAWVKVPVSPPAGNLASGGACQELVKKLVAKKVEELENPQEVKLRPDRLICPYDKHAIPLPVHFVDEKKLLSFPSAGFVYKERMSLLGVDIVPQRFYHGYLLVAKVIPKSEYEKRYGKCRCVSELPREYIIQGKIFYDTEDAFLLQTEENHKILSGMDETDIEKLTILFHSK